jgi:SAM-dependent methyltransferase
MDDDPEKTRQVFMNRQLDDVDRADVESLLAMSRVHLEASSLGADRIGTVKAPPTPPVLAEATGPALEAAQHARRLLAEQNTVGTTRFALPKRVVLRLSRLFTHRLVAAGQALADAVESSVREQAVAVDQARQESESSLQAQLVSVEMASQNALHSLATTLLDRMAELELGHKQYQREIQRLRALAGASATALPDQGATALPDQGATAFPDEGGLDDSTYVEFERLFRGSPQEIKQRQLDALRFVGPIAGCSAPLLDLGCGRGEWLEVLRDAGISAYGVDFNARMVAEAQVLGLDARCQDAVTHLESLDPSSLQGVSAFHFAEHVPLQILEQVLDAAFLALRPGGLLLIETPNPTNLIVGSAAFYLDPTHLRPLHPDFLAFFVKSRGFEDVQLHFVHPVVDEGLLREGTPDEGYDPRLSRVVESAEWALFGPQDYVVLARRGERVA